VIGQRSNVLEQHGNTIGFQVGWLVGQVITTQVRGDDPVILAELPQLIFPLVRKLGEAV